jgi:hypothetical protein
MTRFWRLLVLAGVVAGTVARAQMNLPSDINLFGDDFVQKLTEGGRRLMPKERSPDKVDGFRHTLLFQDGRQLRGELVEVTKDEIVWRRADTAAPLRFLRSDVRRLALAPAPDPDHPTFVAPQLINPNVRTPEKSKPVPATVKLTGGDWLFGNIVSADGESFGLTLSAGAGFILTRDQIEWLHFAEEPAPAFGFSGSELAMEGWLPSAATLEAKDGMLTVRDSAWLGRTVTPPSRFEVAFEVPADGEEGTRLWLQPFGPEPNSYGTGTVELSFGKKAISRLLYVDKFEHQTTPLPPEAQAEKGPVSYRVFYDGVGKGVSVWRNGRQLGDWKFVGQKDANADVANRVRQIHINGISFDREDRGQGLRNLKFNRIQVQPWDGVQPGKDAPASTDDRLSVNEAAPVAGRLEALTDKHIVFSGETKPLQAAKTVYFSHAPSPALEKVDALLLLGQQGEVSAANLEVRDGTVRCRTIFAPALELPADSLQALAFPKRPVAPIPSSDTLVFKNGDELPGALLAAAKGEALRWKMAGGQEVEFQPRRLAGVRLAQSGSAAAPGPTATLELRSGERMRGEFAALDSQNLQLRHAHLGTLTFPRNQLALFYPNPRAEIYDGARDPAAWLKGPNKKKPSDASARAWLYFDGTYVLRQESPNGSYDSDDMNGLQREVSAALDRFEVRGEGAFITNSWGNFGIQISGKKGVAMQAMFSPEEVQLLGGGENNWRNVPIREKIPEATTRLAVRLFVDAKAGRLDVFVNGVPITRSGQNAKAIIAALQGARTVRFIAYANGGSPLVFSNLWIGPWTGELPRFGADAGGVTALANGDATAGAPKELRDGKLSLETEIGPLDLPADKVLAIDFGGAPQPERAAARLRMTDGSVINLDAFRWQNRELVAHSATLGDLRLAAAVVSELVFDPAPPRPPAVAPAKKLAQKREGE